MTEQDLKVVTCNLNRLRCSDKVIAVQGWLSGAGKNTTILGIQEQKARENRLEFNVRRLNQGAQWIIDYSFTEKGGASLIINPSLKILENGVRGNGTAAWAKVEVYVGVQVRELFKKFRLEERKYLTELKKRQHELGKLREEIATDPDTARWEDRDESPRWRVA
ncbi:hypothetical protein R1sor_007130 [Riccia sorocarpa]|uniref:Uncharacterized protein n=1 Tax=Riccia sorocarpa TaxID=122646 RepID=A0ABD3HT11_9MARC